jgi:hypothetical protein
MFIRLAALTFIVISFPAYAQQHGHGSYVTPCSARTSPYAGFERRSVKALSEEQIADLRAERGMRLALPAELNGYPGPLHVIELGDGIGLTPDQRAKVTALYNEMNNKTISLGKRLIQQEVDLERLFTSRTVTPTNLSAATNDIGVTHAALRATHLRYHLTTVEVLTPEPDRNFAPGGLVDYCMFAAVGSCFAMGSIVTGAGGRYPNDE